MVSSALVDIEAVVRWLTHIEERVGRLYTAASKACGDDISFAGFLAQLAEDEASHAAAMATASEILRLQENRPVLDIVLDAETKSHVEDPLDRLEHLLANTRVSKRQVVEYMARVESSELNPVFLYITGRFAQAAREGERMTAEIQEHLSRIQQFIELLPPEFKPSIDVRTFPSVSEHRFLVVDDHSSLRRLVASLLSRRGTVETATNGHDALEKVRVHFYNGIVSDIHMPGMDGMEFYQRAVGYDAHLKKRFLFYSGDISPAGERYLKEQKLCFLHKPFELRAFTDAVGRIVRGDPYTPTGPNG